MSGAISISGIVPTGVPGEKFLITVEDRERAELAATSAEADAAAAIVAKDQAIAAAGAAATDAAALVLAGTSTNANLAAQKANEAEASAAAALAVGATTAAQVAAVLEDPDSAPSIALKGQIARGTGNLLAPLAVFKAALRLRNIKPVVMVTAGSSTTYGQNASTYDKNYVSLLSGYIQAAYPLASGAALPAVRKRLDALAAMPLQPGAQVINVGVGGTRSDTFLTSATRPDVASFAPSLVLIMVGANDFGNQVTAAAFKANLQAQVTALKALITGPCVYWFVQTYARFDAASSDHLSEWPEYGEAMREIALADPLNIAYADISEEYKSLGIPASAGAGLDPFNLVDTDEIHQTDAGHALMADLLRELMGIPVLAVQAAPLPVAAGLHLPATTSRANRTAPTALQTAQSLSIKMKLVPDSLASLASIIGRGQGSTAGRAWNLSTTSAKRPRFTNYTAGTSASAAAIDAGVVYTHTDGTPIDIRVDIDATVRTTAFYISTDNWVTWTQLGTTLTGAASSIFSSTEPLAIGGFTGTVQKVEITSGATVLVSRDFRVANTTEDAQWTYENATVVLAA